MPAGRGSGETLLFDPGRREFLDERATPDAFAAVSLIVVTHWHPDHADAELIGRIVRRSGAKVLCPGEGAGQYLERKAIGFESALGSETSAEL